MASHLNRLDNEEGRLKSFLSIDAETFTSEASFKHITRLLQITLDIEMVSINLIAADRQILKARQGLDLKECDREHAFCNIAIRSYEALVIEDTLKDERVQDNPFVTGSPYLRSYIGAPLTTADGYNLGTICAFSSQPRPFSMREIEIVRQCARLVMNQLDLRSQANIDFLTGINNRRSFESGLESEIARLRRRPGSAVVAFLDIDHFKQVNDRFGHPVGDIVLKEFAAVVMAQCRQNDLFARLGGEEFAVLLPDTDLDSAHIWAERTRLRVAETQYYATDPLRLTVSMGLLELDKTHTTAEVITNLVDNALYEAKRQGRNRVVA